MKMKVWSSIALLAATLLAGVFDAADAAPVPWRSSMVHLQVEGKDLKDVLKDFAASQGIAASIAGNVQGTVSGRFDLPPKRFIDALAATFGFVWLYDGSVLSITSSNDVTRRVFYLDHASSSTLRSTLRRIGIEDERFPVAYDENARVAMVSGPPQYVQTIAEIAQRLDATARRSTSIGPEVRVFKLKNAWAADRDVRIDGNKVTLPGVATVLGNLYQTKAGGGGSPRNAIPNTQRMPAMNDVSGTKYGDGTNVVMPPLPPSLVGKRMLDYIDLGNPPLPDNGPGGAPGSEATLADDSAGRGNGSSLPVIQADPATNSVLIRDIPDRLDQYDSLIRSLDIRPQLIEIRAHIIDIDSNLLRQIGVDWRAHSGHVDLQTSNGLMAQNGYENGRINPLFGTTTLAGNTIVHATPAGAAISAVVGDAGRYLMARVSALQSTSKVRVEASPLIATLDNVEAVIDNTKRFHARVSGYASTDLYSISAGVSLRVLPMVVRDGDTTRIKLSVHIEDGQFTGEQVDNLPVITNSQINTQAIVRLGESLLIAGYSTDKTSNGMTSVPLLSKIPVLGALFRYQSDSQEHMERVFLLSPRILDVGA